MDLLYVIFPRRAFRVSLKCKIMFGLSYMDISRAKLVHMWCVSFDRSTVSLFFEDEQSAQQYIANQTNGSKIIGLKSKHLCLCTEDGVLYSLGKPIKIGCQDELEPGTTGF